MLTPHLPSPPHQTVALDPRYASRKTREFVYGTAAGTLALCSKVRRWQPHACRQCEAGSL